MTQPSGNCRIKQPKLKQQSGSRREPLCGPTHSLIIIGAVRTASGTGLPSRPKGGSPNRSERYADQISVINVACERSFTPFRMTPEAIFGLDVPLGFHSLSDCHPESRDRDRAER